MGAKRQKLEGLNRSCNARYSQLDMKRASRQKRLAKASHTAADHRAVDVPFDQGWVCVVNEPRDRDSSNLARTFAG